ncbi:glycosyltransferase [Methylobacterium pseudosasicola]|uniref:Glycosyltransferase involved in cell wall bisynthesis n=1 Tax=Methylobacterium pseudosasicola TaxID=582667 RepID=A0A1I4VR11_9HYPH|nr:glycosyltransferase [Methylobacterium pseudosasicola]SFN03742.1 Glycosyltransferase involved in cell wall bisynthesis [Methylobacterium pseudosasicola]
MTPSGQKICLSMIVKNEAPVIRRCLDSLRSVIDHWIIVDTGSTDETQDIIRTVMAGIPGSLLERPWVDFAHNRTEALNLAKPHGDYTLVIDADDELIVPAGFMMTILGAPGYSFQIHDNSYVYSRPQLFNNKYKWYYRGVLHEFAECKGIVHTSTSALAMRRGHDGARRLDKSTYERDAAVLEKALQKEKDPFLISRYTFYLAQSYRDCQELKKALQNYLKRTKLGFWSEEIYVSFLSAALLMEALGEPFEQVVSTFDKAIKINPKRNEARFHASRYCQDRKRYVEGYHYAEAGLELTLPKDGLFLQPWMYDYGLQDKYAVHAFNTGQYRACLSACLTVLGCPIFPPQNRPQRAELGRKALAKMVDPAWGANHSTYVAVYNPNWLSS